VQAKQASEVFPTTSIKLLLFHRSNQIQQNILFIGRHESPKLQA
jgi:hypothetical protein